MSDHPVPFAALESRVGILGAVGSGKTFTGIGLIEQLLDSGRQVIIIDPTGVYNGLRSEYEIPIFGGRYADIPVTDADGAEIAKAIISSGTSAIIDVSQLLKDSHASARRFMAGFAAEIKLAPIAVRYLVIDEADEFMPENASGNITQMFSDLKWIVRRGRSEGWRMLMITQRPQDIAKSVLTQCETMIIHRLPSPQDRKAVEEWVKGHAEPGQANEVLRSLASLETGEAWIWSPRFNILTRSMMPPNKSEDRSKTPDADDVPRASLGFKPVDLAALKAALLKPDLVEESHKDDATNNNRLTDIISELRGQLAAKVARIAEMDQGWKADSDRLLTYQRAIARFLKEIGAPFGSVVEIPAQGGGGPSREAGRTEAEMPQTAARPSAAAKAPTAIAKSSGGGNAPSGAIGRGRKALLVLAGAYPAGLSEPQWATLAGYSRKGGTWSTYKGELRRDSHIEQRGQLWYASAVAVKLLAGEVEPLPPRGPQRAARLGNAIPGVRRMVEILVKRWPHFTTRDGLAADLAMAASGGTFSTYLGRLRANGLIEEKGKQLRLSTSVMGEPS